MENSGAIFFRETALLCDPATPPCREEAHRAGRRARDRAPVVRQPGDHGVVGRPVAERGVRHLDRVPHHRRLAAGLGHLGRLPAGEGGAVLDRRAGLHAADPRAGEERGPGLGDVRRDYLREGCGGPAHAGELPRAGRPSATACAATSAPTAKAMPPPTTCLAPSRRRRGARAGHRARLDRPAGLPLLRVAAENGGARPHYRLGAAALLRRPAARRRRRPALAHPRGHALRRRGSPARAARAALRSSGPPSRSKRRAIRAGSTATPARVASSASSTTPTTFTALVQNLYRALTRPSASAWWATSGRWRAPVTSRSTSS